MPNTPLLLGYGASALAQVAPTSDTEFSAVCDIFRASGEIAAVSYTHLDVYKRQIDSISEPGFPEGSIVVSGH